MNSKPKIEPMVSKNGGNVPHQFKIFTNEGEYFQSYRSIIAFKPVKGGKTQLDKNKWDFSETTGTYRNQFLNEKKSETQAKINSGEYELVELN